MAKYNKNFFINMKDCKDCISRQRNAEAGKVWLSVKSFAESGVYSSYKKSSDLVKLILGGYNDSYIATNLGIEQPTVRIHKRNISNELYFILGYDFFDLLKSYNENKEEVSVRMSSIDNFNLKTTDLVSEDIIALVNSSTISPIKSIDLDECKKELSFLSKYSITSIKRDCRSLDLNKLHYILGVIDSSVGNSKDRSYIINLLTGGSLENGNG